jgi:AhpD family alkylhydroperoxidase
MQAFKELSQEEFRAAFPEVCAEILTQLQAGFVPRLFRVAAATDPVLALTAWRMVQHSLIGGQLPRALKELVLVAIAQRKTCDYCVSAHLAIAFRLGVSAEDLETVLSDPPRLRSASTRDMVQLALDMAGGGSSHSVRLGITKRQAFGASAAELVELAGVASLANFLSTLADGLAVQPDPEFVQIAAAARAAAARAA